jgi:hypothetical protein
MAAMGSRTGVAARANWRDRFGLSAKWKLIALLVALNGIDLVLTRLLIQQGATEANPLMRPLVETMWGWVLKTLVVGAIAIALLTVELDDRLWRELQIVVGIYAAVITWNLAVLLVRY